MEIVRQVGKNDCILEISIKISLYYNGNCPEILDRFGQGNKPRVMHGPTVNICCNPYYCTAQIGDTLATERWTPSAIHKARMLYKRRIPK